MGIRAGLLPRIPPPRTGGTGAASGNGIGNVTWTVAARLQQSSSCRCARSRCHDEVYCRDLAIPPFCLGGECQADGSSGSALRWSTRPGTSPVKLMNARAEGTAADTCSGRSATVECRGQGLCPFQRVGHRPGSSTRRALRAGENGVDGVRASWRLPIAVVIAADRNMPIVCVSVSQRCFDPGHVPDHVVAANVVPDWLGRSNTSPSSVASKRATRYFTSMTMRVPSRWM